MGFESTYALPHLLLTMEEQLSEPVPGRLQFLMEQKAVIGRQHLVYREKNLETQKLLRVRCS